MRVRGHDYRAGTKGRSFRIRGGVGGSTVIAMLQCSACPTKGERNFMTLPAPDLIDRKFIQHGWAVAANARHLCPDCAKPKDKPMATKPSPGAVKATAKIFTLLQQHFDADTGRYVADWNDARIARETGMSAETVVEFRREAFGEIKEPAEIQLLRSDINALEKLAADNHATIMSEVAALRGRLSRETAKLGLPV